MANGEKGKGRSQNQRLKLFYLMDYLLEETDETHTKKVAEIIEHLENYHKGIEGVDRSGRGVVHPPRLLLPVLSCTLALLLPPKPPPPFELLCEPLRE